MNSFFTSGKRTITRIISTLLIAVQAFQTVPADLPAEKIAEGKHQGYIVEFNDPYYRELFEDRYSSQRISDTMTLAKGGFVAHSYLYAEGVVSVTPNGYVDAELYEDAPNDPRYSEQWALDQMGAYSGWQKGLAFLEDQSAEGLQLEPAAVKVAVLDTGIDGTHEDLTGRVGNGYDIINGEIIPEGADSDVSSSSHGTMVAGIIAANAYNGLGIAGLAGNYPVTVLPVRVLNQKGSGTIANIVSGIYWAIENDADIINMSFGKRLSYYPAPLAQAVSDAVNAGILVFAAAGNDGASSLENCYPASIDGVHPVGAYEKVNNGYYVCSFSNGGYEDIRGSFYCGPGKDILTTAKGNEYALFTGTSASCACVSAYAAVLESICKSRGGMCVFGSYDSIESILANSISSNYSQKTISMNRLSNYYLSMACGNSERAQIDYVLEVPNAVLGNEDLSVTFSRGADLVAEIAFVCNAPSCWTYDGYGNPVYSAVIVENDGTDPAVYEAEFDFSQVTEGSWKVFACVKLKTDESWEGDWWSDLVTYTVSNQRRSAEISVLKPTAGSILLLKDPEGCTMGNQEVFILDPVSGKRLKTLTTDALGYATIPNSCFKNGSAMLQVFTNDFIYNRTVNLASEIELDHTKPADRTVTVLDAAGNAVCDVSVSVATPAGEFVIGKTDENGSVYIAADNGSYAFTVVSLGEDADAFNAVLSVTSEFDDNHDAAVLNAAQIACCISIPEISSENIPHYDVELKHNGEKYSLSNAKAEMLYLTPGSWDIDIAFNYKTEESNGYIYTNSLKFALGTLNLSSGNYELPVDPTSVSLCLELETTVVRPGKELDYDLFYEDRFGNKASTYYSSITSTLYENGQEIGASAYGIPEIPQDRNGNYKIVFELEDPARDYPGLIILNETVMAEFSFSLAGSVTVSMPEDFEGWMDLSAYAKRADGSVVELERLGNEWETNRYNTIDLDINTPIGVIAYGTDSNGHIKIWTWSGLYSSEEMSITLADNAERKLTPRYLNGSEDQGGYFYFSFEDGGILMDAGCVSAFTYDFDGDIYVPAVSGRYLFLSCEYVEDAGSGRDHNEYSIITGTVASGAADSDLVVDLNADYTVGRYSNSFDDHEIEYVIEIPGYAPLTIREYYEVVLKIAAANAKVYGRTLDTNSYDAAKTRFTLEVPFPTAGSGYRPFEISPLASVSLTVPTQISDTEDAVLDIHLTDSNGTRYKAIETLPEAYSEVMEEIKGIPYCATVYYREKGAANWTAIKAANVSEVNLGKLPQGTYEAKAEFDFTGYELPRDAFYPDDDYSVFVTGSVLQFNVGADAGLVVSASADIVNDNVNIHVASVPGAVVTVFAVMPDNTEEAIKVLTLGSDGAANLIYTPQMPGRYVFRAEAALGGETAYSNDAVIMIQSSVSAPSAFTAAASGAGKIALSFEWTDNSGLTAVLMREGAELGRFTASPAQYEDTGLDAGRIYTYSLVLEDIDGVRGNAVYASARSAAAIDTQAPTTPGNFSAVLDGSSVILVWDRSEDNDRVKAYIIYRNGVEIARVLNRNYTDTGLSLATAYTYSVAAIDPSGNISDRSSEQSVTTSNVVTIDNIKWSADKMLGDAIASDTIGVTVISAEGLSNVSATLRYRDSHNAECTRDIELSPSGHYYYGTVSMEGIPYVESISACVKADGETIAEKSLPINKYQVAKSLTVRLPEGNWTDVSGELNRNVKLTLSSQNAGYSAYKYMSVDGVTFTDMIPEDDYALTLSWEGIETASLDMVKLIPGGSKEMVFDETGLRIIDVSVLLQDGDAQSPYPEGVYLNNRYYYPSASDGHLANYSSDNALLIPRSYDKLKITTRKSLKLKGNDFIFDIDELPISDVQTEYVFVGKRPVLSEKTLTVLDNEGNPVKGVELVISQVLPDTTHFYETIYTDASGIAHIMVLADTAYSVMPSGAYAIISGSDASLQIGGKMYQYIATANTGTVEKTSSAFKGVGDMTLKISELICNETVKFHVTDSYGQPLAGQQFRLLPEWLSNEDAVITDENGYAEYPLVQLAESYSLHFIGDTTMGNRYVTYTAFYFPEAERADGTCEIQMKLYYSPVISGLGDGEMAYAFLYGGPVAGKFDKLTYNGPLYTGYALPGYAGNTVNYAMIPMKGVAGVTLEEVADSALGGKTRDQWYSDGFEAIGAITGTHDSNGDSVINADEEGCMVTVSAKDSNGEQYKGLAFYDFIVDGEKLFRVMAAGEFSLKLKAGAQFTIHTDIQGSWYTCDDVDVTVPAKESETVELLLTESYLNVVVRDAAGNDHPDLIKYCYIFDGNYKTVFKEQGYGTLRVTAGKSSTDALHVFVHLGEFTGNISYFILDNDAGWHKYSISREQYFNGGTIELNAPLETAKAPTLQFNRQILKPLLANVKVKSVKVGGSEVPMSKVSFTYQCYDLSGAALNIPAEATEVTGIENGFIAGVKYPISFYMPTEVLRKGESTISVTSDGTVYQSVTLEADPFQIYVTNALSSSEIEFSKIEENKPNIPDRGYYRHMPKDAPILQAGLTAFSSSVRDLDKSYLFFSTTEEDFEISLNIDGIPVNLPYESIDTVYGGNTAMTVFTSICTPGYEPESGRIWQDTWHLDNMGFYDPDTQEGALMLPLYEPESYPHTYDISVVLRHRADADSEYVYETRNAQITVYADTAYLRCYDFIHYDSHTFGYVDEEISPTYWVRPKTSDERTEYREAKRFCLNWNNTNIFTFRAYFEKPEEVAAAYAVANVPDNCENYFFPLTYDEQTRTWTGTGQLGDLYTIPDGFGISYTLKRAVSETDYPVYDYKDLKKSSDMGIGTNELPEGWTYELTDPKGMTLEECVAKWDAYLERTAELSGDELVAYIEEFFGEDRVVPYPAIKFTTNENMEFTLYPTYELDPELPDANEGRRVGVRYDDGEISSVRIVTDEGAGYAKRDMYGDASLLLPANQDVLDAAFWGQAIGQGTKLGVKYGCEIVGMGLDIYTKASLVPDVDAALWDTSEDWVKDLPPDALKEYRDWQDKKALNDILDIGLGLLGALVPFTLPITVAFDCWLFKKTNEVDDIYKKIAKTNRRMREREERFRREHPGEYDPDMFKYIDPSGYVFEAVEENRIDDVSATVMTKLKDGTWVNWDSEAYGEGPNPQYTDMSGSYGWNVSEGKWKVIFEKDGYITAESIELTVPPAHLDVNIGMVSVMEPVLMNTAPAPGGTSVDFEFNLYMRTADVLASAVLVYDGEEIDAELVAVDAGLTAAGNKQAEYPKAPAAGIEVAKTYRFELDDALPEGASCFVRFKTPCRAYSGKIFDNCDGEYAVVPQDANDGKAGNLSFRNEGYSVPLSGSLSLSSEIVCDGTGYLGRAKWTSLNPAAFAVDQNGVVTTVSGGTGYIRVEIDGLSAICGIADNVRAGKISVLAVNAVTGEEIAPAQELWYAEGEEYTVEAPMVDGYTTDTTLLYGIMGTGDKQIRVAYNPVPVNELRYVSRTESALTVSFGSSSSGNLDVTAAAYDANGKMLWAAIKRVSNPRTGQNVTLEIPSNGAEATIRVFATDESEAPVVNAIEAPVK